MTRLTHAIPAALLLALVCPLGAAAQGAPDDPSGRALLQLGPVAVQPRFTMRNLGFDTNVFNAANGGERDFTATFVPSVDAWLRLGRTQLMSRTTAELLYFSRSVSQRSVAVGQELRLDVDLMRVRPFVSVGRSNSFTRPTLEFDSRIQRIGDTAIGGVAVQLSRAITLEVEGRTGTVKFGEGASGDTLVAEALDHRSQQMSATGRVAVTRLTTFVVAYEQRRDRFEESSLRDTDVTGLMSGFEFRPRGVLSGRALVGHRRVDPVRTDVPPFSGVGALADVRYLWRDSTRFVVRVKRDIDYSFEPAQPYFVETGVGLTMTQLLGGMWDAMLQASNDRLAYRAVELSGLSDRVDRIRTLTVGVGYHLTFEARVGFEITAQRRRSPIAERNFDGLRFGGVFSYGY